MMLCAVIAVRAQIDNRLHWYNGQITFQASHIEHNNVLMEAMDEGEEHEFILRYVKEVNPNHQVYLTANGTHDYVNLFGVGIRLSFLEQLNVELIEQMEGTEWKRL